MLRLIGDIHTNRKKYLSLIEGAEYSLQVGDLDILGFDWLIKEGVDSEHHKFIGGNHDNYDRINEVPHNLGDFGVWSVCGLNIFFVRGAWSIDLNYRTAGVDWWPEEELAYDKCKEAIELYDKMRPDIVVSHAAPTNVIQYITNPEFARNFGFDPGVLKTRTDEMLHQMVEIHAPKVHIFGHYHRRFDCFVDGRTGVKSTAEIQPDGCTRYICLPEFGTIEIDSSILES